MTWSSIRRYPGLVQPAVDPDHADHRPLRGLDVGPGNVDRRPAARCVGFGQEKAPGADDVRRTAHARDHVGRPGPLPDIGIVRQGRRRGPYLRHRPRQPDHAQQHRGEQPHDAFLWHRHRPAGSLHHSRRLHSPLSVASTMSCAWSQHAPQMLLVPETFAVDLVDVLGARRTRGEPAAVRDDLDAADGRRRCPARGSARRAIGSPASSVIFTCCRRQLRPAASSARPSPARRRDRRPWRRGRAPGRGSAGRDRGRCGR